VVAPRAVAPCHAVELDPRAPPAVHPGSGAPHWRRELEHPPAGHPARRAPRFPTRSRQSGGAPRGDMRAATGAAQSSPWCPHRRGRRPTPPSTRRATAGSHRMRTPNGRRRSFFPEPGKPHTTTSLPDLSHGWSDIPPACTTAPAAPLLLRGHVSDRPTSPPQRKGQVSLNDGADFAVKAPLSPALGAGADHIAVDSRPPARPQRRSG